MHRNVLDPPKLNMITNQHNALLATMLGIFIMSMCVTFSLGFQCSSSLDCSLNGNCIDSKCECDSAWTGPACAQLNEMQVDPGRGIYRKNNATWGLSVLQDQGNPGLWHGYTAVFAGECGLDSWIGTSMIWHLTAYSPAGPFVNETVVQGAGETSPTFRHNPTAVYHPPSKKVILTHIGCGNQTISPQYMNCSSGRTPSARRGGSILQASCSGFESNAMVADAPNGPWSADVTLVGAQPGQWPNSMDNPAPLVLANGTIISMFRSYNHSHESPYHSVVGIARGQSTSWSGPYDRPTAPILGQGTGGGAPFAQLEDPFFWQDHRGFKALFHTMGGCESVGCFAYSLDSYTWHMTGREVDGIGAAYSKTVQMTDGTNTTYDRRERPHLVFVPGSDQPIALTNGVLPHGVGDHSHSIVVPLVSA